MALSSCLCCKLKTGCLTVACLGLLFYLMILILDTVVLVNATNDPDSSNVYIQFEIKYLIVGFLGLVKAILLIIGVVKEKPVFFLPWIALKGLGLILYTPFGLLGCLLISPYYCWYVVYSLYKKTLDSQLTGLQVVSVNYPYGNNIGNSHGKSDEMKHSLYPDANKCNA